MSKQSSPNNGSDNPELAGIMKSKRNDERADPNPDALPIGQRIETLIAGNGGPSSVLSKMGEAVPEHEDDPDSVPEDDFSDPRLRDYQEFFIPIYNFVRFTDEELKVIDHPAFQRLGKVYQLGQSHLVYRSATHKRFEHVLGTVHVAQKMVNAVRANYNQFNAKGLHTETRCPFEKPPTLEETRFIRLAALLHDIGHLPAGHTLEDELCLLEPHDADKRLKLVFEKTDWVPGVVSPALGPLIDTLYENSIPTGVKITPCEVVRQIVSKDWAGGADIGEIRVEVCRDIVGNTICADLLDYLHRDWHHIGKPRFFETRLFQYMQIRRDLVDDKPKFVISYGQRSRPKTDVVSAVLELLESRYNLGEAVLFHSTKCSAAAMLERGVSEIYRAIPAAKREPWRNGLENELLRYSDDEMIGAMLRHCDEHKSPSGKMLFQSLALRDLYKSVCLVMKDSLDAGVHDLLLRKYVGEIPDEKATLDQKRQAAAVRTEALTTFETDFGLPRGSLVMYCPPAKMNSKIADVKIIRRDGIRTLSSWDAKNKLAGGHCQAQLERFESLWRVEVFLRGSEKDKLDEADLVLLQRGVKLLLLGITDDAGQLQAQALQLAREIAAQKRSKYYQKEPSLPIAARGKVARYPMGAPTIEALFGIA